MFYMQNILLQAGADKCNISSPPYNHFVYFITVVSLINNAWIIVI